MSYNPSADYGRNAFATDKAQQKIAAINDEYLRAVLGDTSARDQDELRDQMSRMRALLGEIRVRAQEIAKETQAELEARKGLLELAKA